MLDFSRAMSPGRVFIDYNNRMAIDFFQRGFLVAFLVFQSASAAPGQSAQVSSDLASREIVVTTLADYHPRDKAIQGSLRWALHRKGPSVIRFAVSGNIDLVDTLAISQPYVAIDGSTAPGEGVTLRRAQVQVIDTHDVVLRHLRFRCGDGFVDDKARRKMHGDYNDHSPKGSGGLRSLLIWGKKKEPTRNILIENCSIQNSTDDNANVWGNCRGIVFRRCLMSGGYAVVRVQSDVVNISKGLMAGVEPGKQSMNFPDYLTIDQCLFAYLGARAPDINGSVANIVNCVIVASRQGGVVTKTRANIVNNSCWSLPDHPWGANADRQLTVDVAQSERGAYYLAGNYMDGVAENEKVIGLRNQGQSDLPAFLLATSPWPGLPADILSAPDALRAVLRDAGCTLPRRDAADEQVITRVKSRIGSP